MTDRVPKLWQYEWQDELFDTSEFQIGDVIVFHSDIDRCVGAVWEDIPIIVDERDATSVTDDESDSDANSEKRTIADQAISIPMRVTNRYADPLKAYKTIIKTISDEITLGISISCTHPKAGSLLDVDQLPKEWHSVTYTFDCGEYDGCNVVFVVDERTLVAESNDRKAWCQIFENSAKFDDVRRYYDEHGEYVSIMIGDHPMLQRNPLRLPCAPDWQCARIDVLSGPTNGLRRQLSLLTEFFSPQSFQYRISPLGRVFQHDCTVRWHDQAWYGYAFNFDFICGVCIALQNTLAPYPLLWVLDYLPLIRRLSHQKKIAYIQKVYDTINAIYERRQSGKRLRQ